MIDTTKDILKDGSLLVEQVRKSERTPLVCALLHGERSYLVAKLTVRRIRFWKVGSGCDYRDAVRFPVHQAHFARVDGRLQRS